MRGFPTIAACGFIAAFYSASVFYMIPASAWRLPSATEITINLPSPRIIFGIGEVFRKINERISRE